MNFLYLRSAKENNDSMSKAVFQNPSQAVAALIFQLNTDVAAFSHLVHTIDPSNYTPQLRDTLDNMSQDIMLKVKETLDKLSDYLGWSYDQTTNITVTITKTKEEEAKGYKFAKDFQAVLEEFRKALNLAAATSSVSQAQTPFEAVAARIEQINGFVLDYRTLVDVIGTSEDTPEHHNKLQEIHHEMTALITDTSAKIKALGALEHSAVKSKKSVKKMKTVFRWWKSEDPAPEISEAENSEAVRLSNNFQVAIREFKKAQLLALKRSSSSNKLSSISTEGTEHDILEAHYPLLFDQKRQESFLPETDFNEAVFEEWIPRFKEVQGQVEQVYVIVDTMLDLAILAHEQEINIDDIDARIEASLATTSISRSRRSCSSWSWSGLLAVFAIVIIGILLLILIL